MLNLRSGLDEAKYYAMVASVAVTEASPRIRAKVLRRLVKAVEEDAAQRVVSRDLDVVAATRVRSLFDE